MSSGKQHHKAGTPPPPLLQRVLMACSSLLYLCCSYAWSHFGYRWLGLWFCLVSALSVAADAGSGLLPERAIGRLRVADRLVGSIGLVTSVVINSDSIPHAGLCCLATASSLCWLAAGRVARAEPHNRRNTSPTTAAGTPSPSPSPSLALALALALALTLPSPSPHPHPLPLPHPLLTLTLTSTPTPTLTLTPTLGTRGARPPSRV